MRGYWLVSLFLNVFHLLVTSFVISCFSFDTSYLSISDIHTSCGLSFHWLTNPKSMYVRLINKHPMTWYCINTSSGDTYHIPLLFIWEYSTSLLCAWVFPNIFQLPWSFLPNNQTCNSLHWSQYILWHLPYNIYLHWWLIFYSFHCRE